MGKFRSQIRTRILRGILWTVGGGILSRAITLLSTVVVARILGKEYYGQLSLVVSTVGMFGVLAGLGLGVTATKFLAELKDKDKQKAGNILGLCNLVAIVSGLSIMTGCMAFAPFFSKSILGSDHLSWLIILGALTLPLSAWSGVQSGALAGFEAFKKVATLNVIQGLITSIFVIPLVYFGGIYGGIISQVLNVLIGVILGSLFLKATCRENKIKYKFGPFQKDELAVLLKFTAPSIISMSIVPPTIWVTNTILVNNTGGFGELGLFNAANQIRMVILMIPSMITSVLLPIMSERYESSRGDFNRISELNVTITASFGMPAVIILITSSSFIADFFGKAYSGVEVIIPIIALTSLLGLVNGNIINILISSGNVWPSAVMNILWAISFIALSHVLTPIYGAVGLALACLFAYELHTIWQLMYVNKFIMPRILKRNIKEFTYFSLICLLLTYWSFLQNEKYFYRDSILVISLLISFISIVFSIKSNKNYESITLSMKNIVKMIRS